MQMLDTRGLIARWLAVRRWHLYPLRGAQALFKLYPHYKRCALHIDPRWWRW